MQSQKLLGWMADFVNSSFFESRRQYSPSSRPDESRYAFGARCALLYPSRTDVVCSVVLVVSVVHCWRLALPGHSFFVLV